MANKRKRDWAQPAPLETPPALREAVGGHPLVADHLARKGILTPAAAQRFLSPDHYSPAPPDDLPDIDHAIERLKRALRHKERILIWGDFDVDGQTSTALLYSALKRRGANVTYHVPNRFREGHGIHPPTLKRKLADGIDLVLTCDTGVSAHAAVDLCSSRGIDIIITDHHALPATLPKASALVNPQRLPEGHALRELPGVGVAYKLIEALYDGDSTADLLDLVALGIVADVMAQVDDARYLLQRGLTQLRQNQRLGIRAILEQAKLSAADLNEGHIGFAIAPRLNALGRLEDANPAVELLITDDWARARVLAQSLESANARRKYLSNQVYHSAIAQIERQPWLLDYAALVLSHEDWHSGVIGIVASRLVEEFGLPTILLAAPDETARGSARSVPGLNITRALNQASPLLTSHGGHKMAAGMSLPAADIFQFRRELSRAIRAMDVPPAPPLTIDGCLSLPEISLDLTRDIERLAPFGNGNPPLTLLTRDLKLRSRKGLGRRGEHLQVEVEDASGNQQRVIWWRGSGRDLPNGSFDLAYTLRSSVYKSVREPLVEWLDYRQRDDAPITLQADEPSYALVDCRQSANPIIDLAAARQSHPSALIWSEATHIDGAVNRLALELNATLIVWSPPPSPEIWSAALATVLPERLILFGAPNDAENPSSFLQRLAGLAKYSVNHRDGAADLQTLAAATGQTEPAVKAGLQLLRAMGKLDYQVSGSGLYHLQRADAPPATDQARPQNRLKLLLRESRAYRKYWLKMDMETTTG